MIVGSTCRVPIDLLDSREMTWFVADARSS